MKKTNDNNIPNNDNNGNTRQETINQKQQNNNDNKTSKKRLSKSIKVRLPDYNLTNILITGFEDITKKNIEEKSKTLTSQQDIRTLEQQFSKINASFSKHLLSNVRVMDTFEKQLVTKVELEPLDNELEERVTELNKKLLEMTERLNYHRKYTKQACLEHLQKSKEFLQNLKEPPKTEDLNIPTVNPSSSSNNEESYTLPSGIEFKTEEVVRLFRKFLQSSEELSEEIPKITKSLQNADVAMETIKNNEDFLSRKKKVEEVENSESEDELGVSSLGSPFHVHNHSSFHNPLLSQQSSSFSQPSSSQQSLRGVLSNMSQEDNDPKKRKTKEQQTTQQKKTKR
ncbi:hypothetical protein ABK040_014085 [Willaertia magna]